MRLLSRNFGVIVLLTAMTAAVIGCGQHPREPSPKALKDIETNVPKLARLPLRKAEVVLAFVALKVGKVSFEETQDASLHGQVFDQDPPPGTPARGGTEVNVKVYRFVPVEKESSPAETK